MPGTLTRMCAAIIVTALTLSACALGLPGRSPGASPPTVPPQAGVQGEQATVTRVVDGDTIEVDLSGVGYRVRYIGVNTPERDEVCHAEASEANRALVADETVTLVRDEENTDRYGRLLRYVYVGDRFVNALLTAGGYAEAVEYPPNTRHTAYMRELERAAQAAGLGCHPTGIFDDGSHTR